MKTRARKSLNDLHSLQSKAGLIREMIQKYSYGKSKTIHRGDKKSLAKYSPRNSSKRSLQHKTSKSMTQTAPQNKTCNSMTQTHVDIKSSQQNVRTSLKPITKSFVLVENDEDIITGRGEPIVTIIDDEISFNLNNSRHFLQELTANLSHVGTSQTKTTPRNTQDRNCKINLLKRCSDRGMGTLEMQQLNKKRKRASSPYQRNEMNPSKKMKKSVTIDRHQQEKLSLLRTRNENKHDTTAKLLAGNKKQGKSASGVIKNSLKTLSFSRVVNSDSARWSPLRNRKTNSVKSITPQEIDTKVISLLAPQEVSLNETSDPYMTRSVVKNIGREIIRSTPIKKAHTQTQASTRAARKPSRANNLTVVEKSDIKANVDKALKKSETKIKYSTFQERNIKISSLPNSQIKSISQMLKTSAQVSEANTKNSVLKTRRFPTKKSSNKISLKPESHKSDKESKSAIKKYKKIESENRKSVQETIKQKILTRPKSVRSHTRQSAVNGADNRALYDSNNPHDEQNNLNNATTRNEHTANTRYYQRRTISASLIVPSKKQHRAKQSPTTKAARDLSRKILKPTKHFETGDREKQTRRNRLTIPVKKFNYMLSSSLSKTVEEDQPTKDIGEKNISASRNENYSAILENVKSMKVNDTSARRSLFTDQTKETSKTKQTPSQDTTQKRYFGYRTFPIILTSDQACNTSVRKSFPDTTSQSMDNKDNKRITNTRKSKRLSTSSHNLSTGANKSLDNLTQTGKLLKQSHVCIESIVVPLSSQINKFNGKEVIIAAAKSQDKKQGKSQSLTLVTTTLTEGKQISPLLVPQKTRRKRVRKTKEKSEKLSAKRKSRSHPRSSTPKKEPIISSPLKVMDRTRHTSARKSNLITISTSKKKSDGSDKAKMDAEIKVKLASRSRAAGLHEQMEKSSYKATKSSQERSTQTSFEIFTPSPTAVRTPRHRRKSTQTEPNFSKSIEADDEPNFFNITELMEQAKKDIEPNVRSKKRISITKRTKKSPGANNSETHMQKRLDTAISRQNHVNRLKKELPKSNRMTHLKKSASYQKLAFPSSLNRKDKINVTSLSQPDLTSFSQPDISSLSQPDLILNAISSEISKKNKHSLSQQSNRSKRYLKDDLSSNQKQNKSNNLPAPIASPKQTLISHNKPANNLKKTSKENVALVNKEKLSEKKTSRRNNLKKMIPHVVGKRASIAMSSKNFMEQLANHTQLKQSARIANKLKPNGFENIGQTVKLKQSILNQNTLKQNSPKQNSLQSNSLTQKSVKQISSKQKSRVRKNINYSLVKLIFSDKKSVPHNTPREKSTVILPKTKQTPKIIPRTEKEACRELHLLKYTESTSNEHSTSSSSVQKKRNIDNVKRPISSRSKQLKSKSKVIKTSRRVITKKRSYKKNNYSLASCRKTVPNLSRVQRPSLSTVIKPAVKQPSIKAQIKKLANQKAQGKKLNNPTIPSIKHKSSNTLTLTCTLGRKDLGDLNKNISLEVSDQSQESKAPLMTKKLGDKITTTPLSNTINKKNINTDTIRTGSITEGNSRPRRSAAGVKKSVRTSIKLLTANSSPLKTRQPKTADKFSTVRNTTRRRNNKTDENNLLMKTNEKINKDLNSVENKTKLVNSSQQPTYISQLKTPRLKNKQATTASRIFISASSIANASQERILGTRHRRYKQTHFKEGQQIQLANEIREDDSSYLQKQPKSQALTPIKISRHDLKFTYQRPYQLIRHHLGQKKSKLKVVGVKTVQPKLVVTESSPSNNLDLDVNYDYLLSNYFVQHENPLMTINKEAGNKEYLHHENSEIDLPQTKTSESDYGRRMLRLLRRDEVLKSPYGHQSDALEDYFWFTNDISLDDISQNEQNGDLNRDEMLMYITPEKSDEDEFHNFLLEGGETDNGQNEIELYENQSIITDASYQNDIEDFEGIIPIDHASQSQHCIIS